MASRLSVARGPTLTVWGEGLPCPRWCPPKCRDGKPSPYGGAVIGGLGWLLAEPGATA